MWTIYDSYLARNANRLDITPTMFKEATEHYNAVASYLAHNGVIADFYPDGSFATGTVVRPYNKDDDAFFDLDIVGKRTDVKKNETTAEKIRSSFEDTLNKSDRYAPMLETCDECITLSYSSENRDGFKLDIVPSVPEYAEETGDPICIACRDSGWLPSNPKGLADWFMDINRWFASTSSTTYRRELWQNNRDIYCNIEDVPEGMLRTSLQRGVQVLKRSRDVYCYEGNNDLRMPSCAIMVITASIAQYRNQTAGIWEIIQCVVSRLIRDVEAGFGGTNGLLGHSGDWHVINPVSGGNLVEWNDGDMHKLLRWLQTLTGYLKANPSSDPTRFNASMRSMFGSKSELVCEYPKSTTVITAPTRPWAWL